MEQQAPSKGLSIAGLVLGAVAIVLSFWSIFIVPAWIGLILAVVGLILAILGRKKYSAAGMKSGLATAAFAVALIAVIICGIFAIACTVCVGCAASKAVSDSGLSSSDLQELEDWANSLQ